MTALYRRPRLGGKRRGAFTLIEILVVVAILAMLASVGTVQLLRARMIANESATLSNLHHLARAAQHYLVANQRYPDDLLPLAAPIANPPYLDASFVGDGTTVTRQGYVYTYDEPNPELVGSLTFRVLGNPSTHGITGERHFYLDQTMGVHVTTENRNATVADPLTP